MKRFSNSKGEREVVRLARAAGLRVEQTWHTAQSGDRRVRADAVRIAERPYQVKRQRNGSSALYNSLENVAGLFARSYGHECLAVVPAARLFKFLRRGADSE